MSPVQPAPPALPASATPFRTRLNRAVRRWRGERTAYGLEPFATTLRALERTDLRALADAELLARARALRGPTPDETAVFALVREAARRALGLEAHACQLAAGLAMVRGRVAELPTGEGKTLAAVFTAVWHGLSGRGVHVLTFNDYLARRDAAWMGPVYRLLGVTVGCVQEGQSAAEKRAAYAADVTYGTAKEVGFDFLRDGIALDADPCVHRPFHAVIVDEADSVLVDEARVPLVLAGVDEGGGPDVRRVVELTRGMQRGVDFETDAEQRNVFLTDAGARQLESALGCASLYDGTNQGLLEAAHCALHAHALLHRDVDYLVRDGRIQVIDEFTGRIMEKRHWPDGIQAALEAKEGMDRRTRGRVLGSITLQHFLRLYPHLAGMTATAQAAAEELQAFYRVDVHVLPPHTPSHRTDQPDAVFTHQAAKRRALLDEIGRVHATGRPILVGTLSVAESEDLAAALQAAGVRCAVLNARNDQEEAAVIAEAGALGAVTISTNMAGRGTDIRLGGSDERERAAVVALGGLYVLGTNRHESVRVDRQLRGRAGRQGDPGSTRFFIALDDDLFRRYGLTDAVFARHGLQRRDGEVDHGGLRADVEHAQRVIEGQCFDIRHDLFRYSNVVEQQRRLVRARREAVQRGDPEARAWEAAEPQLYARAVARWGAARAARVERNAHLLALDRAWAEHLCWVTDTRETVHLVSLSGQTPVVEFRRWCTEAFARRMEQMDQDLTGALAGVLAREDAALDELEHARGPSSTWTYLVNDDPFQSGFELLKGGALGFSAIAAGVYGPLLLAWLVVRRWWGGKRGGKPA
ncbi:MAG: accessory Sec system translocase SecA2 [Deltaproteobacteria bacterium]|nr:accessory Sec system translocase SecA2 [Deltaproteobacteria bacterium]